MQLHIQSPSPASVLRAPSPDASCTCAHPLDCLCACHSPSCDPGAEVCDIAFLADDGGLTPWGCALCTPGAGAPHGPGCEVIGWHVPMGREERSAG
ncbi:MAG TPA: hypothetical protein VIR16_10825 [Candidatus Limnocylindrales bacterium]